MASGQVLKTLEPLAGNVTPPPTGEDKPSHTYVSLQYRQTMGGLVGVAYDHNILFYMGEDLKRTKQVLVKGGGATYPTDQVNYLGFPHYSLLGTLMRSLT